MQLSMVMILELISLGTSVPTIILSFLVVFLWLPKAYRFFRPEKGSPTATDWFAFGIGVGFLGEVLDNLYWTVAWAANFLDHPWWDWLVAHGSKFNIVFRQSLTTIAAYSHIKAFLIYEYPGDLPANLKESFSIGWVSAVLVASGVLFAVTLYLMR